MDVSGQSDQWSQSRLRGFKRKNVSFTNIIQEPSNHENSNRDNSSANTNIPENSRNVQTTARNQNRSTDQWPNNSNNEPENTNLGQNPLNDQGRICRFFLNNRLV